MPFRRWAPNVPSCLCLESLGPAAPFNVCRDQSAKLTNAQPARINRLEYGGVAAGDMDLFIISSQVHLLGWQQLPRRSQKLFHLLDSEEFWQPLGDLRQ